jgi:hypothetical protein
MAMPRANTGIALAFSLVPTTAAGCSATDSAVGDGTLISTNDRVVLRKRPLGEVDVRALLVHQIEVRFDQVWPAAQDAVALQELRAAFGEAVRADLMPAYPLAKEPGPGVVLVQTFLTDRIRDPELLARLPPEAAGAARHAFLELELLDSRTNEKQVSAVFAPQPIAWELLLDPRIPRSQKVLALRRFTGALRNGLDANRDARVR